MAEGRIEGTKCFDTALRLRLSTYSARTGFPAAYLFSSGATEIRTVSPLLPGKPVNIASTKFGTR